MSTLEILGQSHNGHTLWIRIDDEDELEVFEDEVDLPGGVLFGLNHLQRDAVAKAFRAPQRLWPPVACRYCGADASLLIEGDPYCHGHGMGFLAWEEGQ